MKRFVIIGICMFSSIVHAFYSNERYELSVNDHTYEFELKPFSTLIMAKVEYSSWIWGELLEKRFIQQHLNGLCADQGGGLDPSLTVCSSGIFTQTNCFSVCSDSKWIPPWNDISSCDSCSSEDSDSYVIESREDIGRVLFQKELSTTIVRIPEKVLKKDKSEIIEVFEKICKENNGLSHFNMECGESYNINYSQCSSGYEFYDQCLGYCTD